MAASSLAFRDLFIIFFVAGGGVMCRKNIIFASEGFGVFAGNVWCAHVRINDDLTTTRDR